MQCYEGNCIDPCHLDDACGDLAECTPVDHKAQCKCIEGTTGNPHIKCQSAFCRADAECPPKFACRNGRCEPVCETLECGVDAYCYSLNHTAYCDCPPGYSGQPTDKCEPSDPLQRLTCKVDRDCGVGLVCIGQTCTNPCITSPCGSNALCQVRESTPFKSIICECKKGYYGDANRRCKPSKN